MGMLLTWATSHSLERVRRNLTMRPELISLIWKADAANLNQQWQLNLLITNKREEECLQALIKAMTNLGVEIERHQKSQTKIKESDVTKEAIASMDIDQILRHIQDYEEEIAAYDLSISTI